MEPHITKIMQIAFLKIRQISYYRKFLTPSAAETLIHAYIAPRLDYCNGLLHGLPTNLVAKLRSNLNTAARLVTKTRKYEHITPVMINLHWLPIQYNPIFVAFNVKNYVLFIFFQNQWFRLKKGCLRPSLGSSLMGFARIGTFKN